MTKGIEFEVGEWKGTANLIATLIDDFKVIYGMDFLTSGKTVPMPH